METPVVIPESPTSNRPMNRRETLAVFSFTGMAWMFAPTAAAASPKVITPTATAKRTAAARQISTSLADVPDEWMARNRSNADAYLKYLGDLKLRCVDPARVVAAHAKKRRHVWNTLPPKAWWVRMGYTLRVVDRIALMMKADEVEITSAYRCPSYNRLCPGAKSGSYHQANCALDVRFPFRASQVTAYARNVRDRGLFKGGVGGYWNFTHIDTRGENTNW
jgi:hypothetical protein